MKSSVAWVELGNGLDTNILMYNPDMITLAKALASGYAPIAVLMTNEEIFQSLNQSSEDSVNFFRDISTYGGCTAGPAASIKNIEIMETEALIENSRKVGAYLLEQLQPLLEKYDIVGDVRGMGLFAGVEMVENKHSKIPMNEAKIGKIIAMCKQQGVIIGSTNRSLTNFNNTLVMAPPLICSEQDMDEAVSALDDSLEQMTQLA